MGLSRKFFKFCFLKTRVRPVHEQIRYLQGSSSVLETTIEQYTDLK